MVSFTYQHFWSNFILTLSLMFQSILYVLDGGGRCYPHLLLFVPGIGITIAFFLTLASDYWSMEQRLHRRLRYSCIVFLTLAYGFYAIDLACLYSGTNYPLLPFIVGFLMIVDGIDSYLYLVLQPMLALIRLFRICFYIALIYYFGYQLYTGTATNYNLLVVLYLSMFTMHLGWSLFYFLLYYRHIPDEDSSDVEARDPVS